MGGGGSKSKPCTKIPEECLDKILKHTDYDDFDVRKSYKHFIKRYPNGRLTPADFREVLCNFFPVGNSTSLSVIMFQQFDTNKDGYITFDEFIIGLFRANNDSWQVKLKWIFCMFDLDGNGLISKEEMHQIFKALYEASSQSAAKARHQAERLFHKYDVNRDGVINYEEFTAMIKADKSILELLNSDDVGLNNKIRDFLLIAPRSPKSQEKLERTLKTARSGSMPKNLITTATAQDVMPLSASSSKSKDKFKRQSTLVTKYSNTSANWEIAQVPQSPTKDVEQEVGHNQRDKSALSTSPGKATGRHLQGPNKGRGSRRNSDNPSDLSGNVSKRSSENSMKGLDEKEKSRWRKQSRRGSHNRDGDLNGEDSKERWKSNR